MKEAKVNRNRLHAAMLTRRQALRTLGVVVGGVALGSCTPAKIIFRAYPREFDESPELTEKTLRSFVTTVIPGASSDDPNLAQVYFDEDYPFAPYSAFLASDLCARARDDYGVGRFDLLDEGQRTQVIRGALRHDATTGRLYAGAIFLAQISFYAGIYNDEQGCQLIGFPGGNRGPTPSELGYPSPQNYLAHETTVSGSPA
jgi:hypothetical protein